MKHSRNDYDRIQDPSNKIGIDEPVFLVRAKDICAPLTVRAWARLARLSGNEEMASKAEGFATEMEEWQIENGCKKPDLPSQTNIASVPLKK